MAQYVLLIVRGAAEIEMEGENTSITGNVLLEREQAKCNISNLHKELGKPQQQTREKLKNSNLTSRPQSPCVVVHTKLYVLAGGKGKGNGPHNSYRCFLCLRVWIHVTVPVLVFASPRGT